MPRVRTLAFSLTTFLLTALFIAIPAFAGREDDTERQSKNGRTEGIIDGVAVTVEFGRPHVRERKIWGELVPFDKVWRTGADEATTVTFSENVNVEGQALDAGTYSLFTIPGEGKWTVIFNRQVDQWGAYKYEVGEDVLRVLVVPREHDHVEEMDFAIQDSEVILRWEKLAVPIRVAKR